MKLSDKFVRLVVQLMKFNLIGIVNTAVDLSVFLVLYSVCGISSYAAHCIAYLAGTLNSFYWNRRWTFRQQARSGTGGRTFLRFIILNGITLALSTLGLVLLTGHMDAVWAKLTVTVGTMAVNFCVSRMWVFTQAAERG